MRATWYYGLAFGVKNEISLVVTLVIQFLRNDLDHKLSYAVLSVSFDELFILRRWIWLSVTSNPTSKIVNSLSCSTLDFKEIAVSEMV